MLDVAEETLLLSVDTRWNMSLANCSDMWLASVFNLKALVPW